MDKHLENGFKQVKKLSFATLFLNEDKSILMIKYHEETVVDVEKSVLVIDAVFPFIEQGAIYGITDATAPFLNITPGARKNYRDNKSLQLSFAHAVVVKELSVRLMANFFCKVR